MAVCRWVVAMHISRELLYLTTGIRLRMAALVVIGLLIVAAGLASLAFTGQALGAVFSGRPLSEVAGLILAAAATALGRGVLLHLREAVGAEAAGRVKTGLRTRIFQHLSTLGPGFLERRRTGELVASAVDGVEHLEVYYGKYFPQLLVTVIAPIGILGYFWTLDPAIAIVVGASLPLALGGPWALRQVTSHSSHQHWRSYSSFAALVLDSLQGLPTLKAFARGKDRGREIEEQSGVLYRMTMRVLGVNLWSTGIMDLAIAGGAALALAVGAVRAAEGHLTLTTLLIVLMLGNQIFRPVQELGRLYHQGLNGISASEGIFALLAERPEFPEPAHPKTVALPTPERLADAPALPAIQFERVTFGYDRGQRPALRDFSLQILAGETVALVGASGAGKTTVLNLLLRYYTPPEGRILVGGVDLRELASTDLRALFAAVSQETYLFHATIAENLRLARPNADLPSLEAAARAANAHEFSARLPDGYDTLVGDRGMRLSGGERQRIAIARALLKDAPVLLLDEPTSSVDAENEEIIQEALRRLTRGRTTLVIAHRLSTVAEADRIVVMQNGQVAEIGAHRELLAADGVYRRLIAAQQVEEPAPLATIGGA